jgi:hypothetical protein
MREKDIEGYLRDRVKTMGGRAYKFVSPGNDGVPDRLILLPGGKVLFIETKASGKTSTPLQKAQQLYIHNLGFAVYEADSKAEIDRILREAIRGEI